MVCSAGSIRRDGRPTRMDPLRLHWVSSLRGGQKQGDTFTQAPYPHACAAGGTPDTRTCIVLAHVQEGCKPVSQIGGGHYVWVSAALVHDWMEERRKAPCRL